MATATTLAPSLLEAVNQIAPIIRENAGRSERNRSLATETVAAMKRAGLYRMTKPRVFGGMEVDPITAVQVWEAVSRIDASAGWNLIISSGGITFGSWIPDQGIEEMFSGDPDSILAGAVFPPGKAIPVDGGYRVTGQWPFASGCQHASWLAELASVYDGDELRRDESGNPVQILFAMPASDAEILDTWHTMGLCATGSHDLSVKDLFVPSHRAGRLAPLKQLPKAFDIPLFHLTVWLPVASLAAPALGNARAAIDALIDLGSKKTPAYGAAPLSTRSSAQMQLGQAEALLGAARAYFYQSLSAAWQTAQKREFLSQSEKIAIQLATSHAIDSSAKVVDLVHQAAGTSAIRLEKPFQRHFRDAHVITQHAFGSISRIESAGKLLFGQPTDWPFFMM